MSVNDATNTHLYTTTASHKFVLKSGDLPYLPWSLNQMTLLCPCTWFLGGIGSTSPCFWNSIGCTWNSRLYLIKILQPVQALVMNTCAKWPYFLGSLQGSAAPLALFKYCVSAFKNRGVLETNQGIKSLFSLNPSLSSCCIRSWSLVPSGSVLGT